MQEKTTTFRSETGWFLATLCVVAGGMFIIGYLVGQRNALDSFLYAVEEQSFADKITCSFYSMNGQELPDDGDGDEQQESTVGDTEIQKNVSDNSSENGLGSSLQVSLDEQTDKGGTVYGDNDQDEFHEKTGYYAPLIGFGTLRAADHCAQKLKKMGIDAHLEERVSQGRRGKKIIWYQIVTENYTDKEMLKAVVERVKQELNIKEINILERRKVNHG